VVEARSDTFVPIDTEDVSPGDEARYRAMVQAHRAHALVSTDGDGDRPLIVDETGRFHRGDMVGLVTAELLGARFAAVPVTVSDALDMHLASRAGTAPAMAVVRTRIGSPYVIAAMRRALAAGTAGVVGWEANGGFLTGSRFALGQGMLAPLPTRDAVLPILAVLLTAAGKGVQMSGVFARLPRRATRAGLLDDFAPAASQAILAALRPGDAAAQAVRFTAAGVIVEAADGRVLPVADDAAVPYLACREALGRYFGAGAGFGAIQRIDYTDGVRIGFAGGDVAHLRPSGNAPQLRIYAVSDTQERADAIVALATGPDGLLQRMARELTGEPHA
jgi:phosphomannomutase